MKELSNIDLAVIEKIKKSRQLEEESHRRLYLELPNLNDLPYQREDKKDNKEPSRVIIIDIWLKYSIINLHRKRQKCII